jgi:hypothetical protein
MTQIPDDHWASKDLERQFEELGRERATSRRPRGRWVRSWRSQHPLFAAVIAVGVCAGTAVGGVAVISDGASVATDPETPTDVVRAPEDRRLSPMRVSDPVEAALPWGVRIYSTARGTSCIVVGQVRDGRLGLVAGRTFRAFPASTPGACGSTGGDGRVLAERQQQTSRGQRSLLYGLVGRDVRSLSLQVGGLSKDVEISPDGAFLVVRAGRGAFAGDALVIRTATGTESVRLR